MNLAHQLLGDHIKGGAESHYGANVAFFEPGNGTRYELMYGKTPNIHNLDGPDLFFCTWMKNGGTGGVTVMHPLKGYCHYSYVKEKMELHSSEDSKAIAHFINTLNCRDYTPANQELPRGMQKEEAPCQIGN